MSKFLTEYLSRKKTNFLIGTNEGLVFFNDDNNNPLIACHTSSFPKTTTLCENCPTGLVLETFTISHDRVVISSHKHIAPDDDIKKIVQQPTIPQKIHHQFEIDEWVWKFFINQSKLKVSPFLRNQEPLSQIFVCATRFPKIYRQYYACYEFLVAGRKYLFFG